MTREHLLEMLREAATQIQIASALYGGRGEVERFADKMGGHPIVIEVAYMRAVAIVFPDVVHVSVCGTDGVHDWVQNLSARQIRYAECKVHRGFAESAIAIRQLLDDRSIQNFIRGRRLIIGGHSAGGAIAELLAVVPWMRPDAVITFGAPRFVSSSTAAAMRSMPWPVHRFVTLADPVPGMPLRRFRCLFGRARYSHTSPALELTDSGRILLEHDLSLARRVAQHVIGIVLYFLTAGMLTIPRFTISGNHGVEAYARRINLAIKRVSK